MKEYLYAMLKGQINIFSSDYNIFNNFMKLHNLIIFNYCLIEYFL